MWKVIFSQNFAAEKCGSLKADLSLCRRNCAQSPFIDKGAKMTDKREALFNLIIDQIKELQKQPSSKKIDNRIHYHINTLHFLMTSA